MGTTWIITLITIIEGSLACFICCKCGSVSPNDPYYYINETSNLICALDQPSQFRNASDLYFTLKGVEMNSSFMTIINETAVSFKKAMDMEDNGTYFCKQRGVDGINETVGGQIVNVDYPVEPVNDIECVWHNWKDKLVCTWTLPPYRYTQYIKVDLIMFNNAYIPCKNMVDMTKCTWNPVDVALDTTTMMFQLNVTNTNEHKYHTMAGRWITKFRGDNVKPYAVESFKHNFTDQSTCLLLSWVYDKNISTTRVKYFRIQYSPVADPSQNKTVWSDEYNLTVCNLTPYTVYKFTIAVHPDRNAVKGFWSDPVTRQILTDQDIPGAAPEMVGYSWQSSELCIQNEKMTAGMISTKIFWKLIPGEERNGNITKYRVTFTDQSLAGPVTLVIVNNPQDSSVNLQLHCNELYNVSISAATTKGYSPLHSSLIINTTAMPPPDVMVERNDSLYNVSWSLPGPVDSLTSFSVVYCVQLGSQKDCSGELQKLSILDSQTRHQTLSLSSDTTYLFGVSIIRAGVASAAQFESCVYVVTETPNAPQFSVDGSIGENSLRVVWDPIPCNNKQPYVKNFTITWCRTKDKQEDQCIDQGQSVEILSTSKTEYIISNLEKDVRYGVTMLSSSSSQSSHHSDMQYGTPTNSDLTIGGIFGIAIAGLFITIFIIAGLLCMCRLVKQEYKKAATPYEIQTPELDPFTDLESSSDSQKGLLQEQHITTNRSISDEHRALWNLQYTNILESQETVGHTNPVLMFKRGEIKQQISVDSGRGQSLSTEEPGSPNAPVPSPAVGTSGSSAPSSVNNPYFRVQRTHQTSVEQSQSSVEQDREERTECNSSSEVDINLNEIRVMFVVVPTNPSGISDATRSTGHDKVAGVPGTPESYVTAFTDHMEAISNNDALPGTAHTLSNESDGMPQALHSPYIDSTNVTPPSPSPYIDSTNVTKPSPTPYIDSTNVTQPSPIPYVDSTNVTQPSPTPYVDSTNVTQPSPTPYVDSTNVTHTSTTPYVDSTNVTQPSPTPYIDSTNVTHTSTTPYVDSTNVTQPSPNPYVDSTNVTQPSPTPYIDSTNVTRPSPTPYVDSTNVTRTSPTPYVDSTNVTQPSPTPYVDSTNVTHTSTTPYVDSTNVTQPSPTPYIDSTNVTHTSTTPYVDSTNVTQPSPNPYVDSTNVTQPSPTPYIDSTNVTRPSPTPYVDSTNVTRTSPTPYVDSTNVTQPSPTPYVDSTNVTHTSTTPYVDSTNVTQPSPTPYIDSTNVTHTSTTPYVDSTNVTQPSPNPYVDSTNVTQPSPTPYIDSTNVTRPSPTPYVDSTNVTRTSPTPYVDSTNVTHTSTTPYVDSTNVTQPSPTPYVDSTNVTQPSTTPYIDSTNF